MTGTTDTESHAMLYIGRKTLYTKKGLQLLGFRIANIAFILLPTNNILSNMLFLMLKQKDYVAAMTVSFSWPPPSSDVHELVNVIKKPI